MKIKYLLIGTSLSLIPCYTLAQCVETDCLKLGYDKLQKCNDGLKCSFGEYWACPCDTSHQYTCTGANEQAGIDKCGNKYKSCNCTDGYEWKDGKCEAKVTLGTCSGNAKNCAVGQILNSDGTCTTNKEASKTPIGVVIYIGSGSDKCGYAMTASPIRDYIEWGGYGKDIPDLPNYPHFQQAITDFNVTSNMIAILNAGDANKYPAAYAAKDYAPNAAPATKGKWVLPTAGILSSLRTNLSSVNNAISKLYGAELTSDEHIWSSSEYDSEYAWLFCNGCSDGVGAYEKEYGYYDGFTHTVRPVIAF